MRETQNRRRAMQGASVALSMVLATALAPSVTPMLAMSEDAEGAQKAETKDIDEPQGVDGSATEASETDDPANGESTEIEDMEAGESGSKALEGDGLETETHTGEETRGSEFAEPEGEEPKDEKNKDNGAELPIEPEVEERFDRNVMAPQATEFYLETQSDESGCSSVSKLTLDEQRDALDALPEHPAVDEIWSVMADVDAYTPSTLSSKSIEYATAYLNLMRRIAGVNGVTFTPELNASAAQGGLILACLDTLTHYPGTPSNATEAQARPGQTAADLGFIYKSGPENHLYKLIKAYVDDGAINALERLAHRTMLLDPRTQTMVLDRRSARVIMPILQYSPMVRESDTPTFLTSISLRGHLLAICYQNYSPLSSVVSCYQLGSVLDAVP